MRPCSAPWPSTAGARRTRFHSTLIPRDSETAWYVDPPSTTSTGAVGGLESVTAALTVWVSRPAASDAAAAAVALAGDLSRLRFRLASLDVGDDGRVNVGERITTTIRPRGAQAVTVVGRIAIAFDYEADGGRNHDRGGVRGLVRAGNGAANTAGAVPVPVDDDGDEGDPPAAGAIDHSGTV